MKKNSKWAIITGSIVIILLLLLILCSIGLLPCPNCGGGNTGGDSPSGGSSTFTSWHACTEGHMGTAFTDYFGSDNMAAARVYCEDNGGTWTQNSREVSCDIRGYFKYDEDADFVRDGEEFCIHDLKADWLQDNNNGYIGCRCNLDEPEPDYTCTMTDYPYLMSSFRITDGGGAYCAGTCPEGQYCIVTYDYYRGYDCECGNYDTPYYT